MNTKTLRIGYTESPIIGHEDGLAAIKRQKKEPSATFRTQFMTGNGHWLDAEKIMTLSRLSTVPRVMVFIMLRERAVNYECRRLGRHSVGTPTRPLDARHRALCATRASCNGAIRGRQVAQDSAPAATGVGEMVMANQFELVM
jgi:hypothetical protein